MEGLTIREATLVDKDAVLAINDHVYDGVDYLPACFDYLMSCPNVKGYVGVVNENIVTFVIAFLVDDGKTVISRAGRVSPGYDGKGIYSFINNYAMQQSGATENSFTAVNTNMAVFSESFRLKNTLVVSKDFHRFDFIPQQVQSNTQVNLTGGHLRSLTNNDLEHYMNSSSHRKYLFPDDVIIVNWVPYRLLPSNIPFMCIPERTNMVSNVEVSGEQIKGLLSVTTVYPSREPLFTSNLDIYGADVQSLVLHVATQIEFLKKRADGKVCVIVYFDKQLGQKAVEEVFKSFGLDKSVWRMSSNPDMIYSRQFLFRKSI